MFKKQMALSIGVVGILATSLLFMITMAAAFYNGDYKVVVDFNVVGEGAFEMMLMAVFFPFMVYTGNYFLNEVSK